MSDNWVVQNLENALDTWNEKLAEIWQLITQSPETFKGGAIWKVIVDIHGALQAIGLALLVLFFVVGVMRTCGDFASVKKPEHALKLFIRFALAKGAVTYGLELMMALFKIVQGVISAIMKAAGFGSAQKTVLPQEIVTAVEDCGFFESIPLWAVTLIGGLFITVLSFIMIMSVYGRFFKLYLYTAIAPVPLSSFAGEPSQSVGKSFIKSYSAVCLEGGNHRACLHHLLGVCGVPARSQPRCGGSHDGVGLYRGIGVQYARPCRCGQDGRPCGKGNDGLVKILYSVDFIA